MKIIDLVFENDKKRTESLNLVASENVLSSQVKKALSLQHSRYHADFYGGTDVFRRIFDKTTDLVRKMFECETAIISPLSGNLAVVAVILSLTNQKDKIATLPLSPGGGYPINLEFFNRKRINIPFNLEKYNIELDSTLELIEKEKPKLVLLGASLILFPQPVQAISKIVHSYGGIVAYDGSHVLGLIAGGQFQDPLKEGADLLLGSTHKSFPGPQGGIILSNGQFKEKLEEVIGINPLKGIVLVDNIHNSRIAALGVAVEEFLTYGKNYAFQVVKNSQSLAYTLNSYDIALHGKNNGFTKSHQVLMKLEDFQQGAKFRDILQDHKIITDAAMRLGTSELTRLAFKEEEFLLIGKIIAHLLHHSLKIKPLSIKELDKIKMEIDQLIEKAKSYLLSSNFL